MTIAVVAARRATTVLLAAAFCAAIGATLVRQPANTRFTVALCLGLCGLILATQWPRTAAVTILALLPFLALLRRLLLDFTAWKSSDPLLLIAPAILATVLVRLYVLERRPLPKERISKLIFFLVLFSFLQALNPRGGGITAGAAALLFTAVPLCWYFLGRELATGGALKALYVWTAGSASIVALYGLSQTWNGLPSWDQAWVDQTGYAALHVGDVVRAFGTFSSSAEYASYLGIGIVVSVAFALGMRPYLLPVVPLLADALFYESSRGAIVTTAFAVIVVLAARTGSLKRATITLAVCIAAVAVGYTVGRGALMQSADTSSNALVSHQLSGLADPFNQEQSTLPTHLALLENGFKQGVIDPIGHGIASTTLAGAQLGSGAASTEVDLSNVFVAYGTLGGFAYLAVVVIALWTALRLAVERRDAVSLSAFGIILVIFGQWLNGGYYAVSPLVWFTIGFVIASDVRSRLADEQPEPDLEPAAADA
jgi:hypothetical protein